MTTAVQTPLVSVTSRNTARSACRMTGVQSCPYSDRVNSGSVNLRADLAQ